MLLIAAVLVVLATGTLGQYQLTIRDNGKLCSPWISTTGGSISLSYYNNNECVSQVGLEQEATRVRLCCTAMATTTS